MSAGLPVDEGGAAHLAPGQRLPGVALASTRGGHKRLCDHPGCAIVTIYPWTGRPGHPNPPDWDAIPGAHGSTPQAQGFAALHTLFAAAGFRIFGLSGQSPADQSEFAGRMALPFELLSDEHFAFADGLALPRFATGGVTYLKRLTLIVRDGLITQSIYPVTDPARHASDLLALIGRR